MKAASATTQLKLKHLATINDEALGEDEDPDYEIRYIDISNVDSSGRIGDVAVHRFDDAPSRARRRVRDGDVIISTVRTYLQSIAQIRNPPDNLIASTGFAVVRPRPKRFAAEYCKYALREPSFLAEVAMRSVGVSYPAVNSSDLAGIPIYVHPLSQQRVIGSYLDYETARIDALITEKEQLLLLLDEKRRALITRYAIRGLDRNVLLRDSGISWLGEIPMHWETERARWLFCERDERSQTGEENLLTVSHLTGVTLRSEKEVNMFEAETKEGYKICRAGDLVINTLWAWMGAMGAAPVDGIVSPAYNVYQPLDQLDPNYVDAIVRLPLFAQEVMRYSKGVWSSRLRLYPEGFFEARLPVPPLCEQRRIVRAIETESRKLDDLARATGRTISLLKERRSALISAAVTGHIDIRGTA